MEGFVRRTSEGDARWFYGNLFIINSPPGFAREVAQAPPAQTLTLPPSGA
jgi:hypothetical protein